MNVFAKTAPRPCKPFRWLPCALAAGCSFSIAALGQESTPCPEPEVPDPLDSPIVPDPSDAGPAETVPIEKALVGAWKFSKRPLDPGDPVITSVNRYSEDGIYACSIHMEFPERERTITIAGRWTVEDGDVKITLTQSDAPELYKPGLIFVLHDARIDGERLVYRDASGVQQTRFRIIEEETQSEETLEPAPAESGAESDQPRE
ncbi:MAG TPA: hypothetical protein VMN36_04200 [Verrucomicrobiales bacterium]|nr:hypothetical protein [Verrucomicrobiales bacterium]